ncbi:hypothetical protein UY3_08281 [Chelonia mydas]|uniref:Uncharacterized protein n=1 Tax=Chelonia mydas TaxID=8469 RepID=M7BQU5_CHEMY|nr:hypothetical protein UY3_08281 [Chelonia mydas]
MRQVNKLARPPTGFPRTSGGPSLRTTGIERGVSALRALIRTSTIEPQSYEHQSYELTSQPHIWNRKNCVYNWKTAQDMRKILFASPFGTAYRGGATSKGPYNIVAVPGTCCSGAQWAVDGAESRNGCTRISTVFPTSHIDKKYPNTLLIGMVISYPLLRARLDQLHSSG